MRNFISIFITLISFFSYSQCASLETIYSDSYEYTTPIPGVIPGTVYGNTPATYAGGIHSGSRHAYLNFVNGFTGPAIDTIYPVCIGSDIVISFWFKDTWGGDNDFTINLYDENDLLLNTQTFTIASNNTWNQYVSPELNMLTNELRFELVNNGTTGGNDLAMDDFLFSVCSIQESSDLLLCSSSSVSDLFDQFSINMPTGGTWSGPSGLANGDQGTFDPNTNVGGVYTYSFASQSPCPTPFGSVQVGNVSNLNLGADTTICSGADITLDAGAGYDFYNWSNGTTGQTINVNQHDTFSVVVGATGSNLVVNGDFELGDSDFTSDYINATGGGWGPLSNPGEYLVTTSPSLGHNNFSFCNDHTDGTGNMFVANGSDVANTNVWSQTVNVDPNTDYLFSTWVTNALNDANVAQLQFFVDGVQIGPIFNTSAFGCDWLEFNASWNSGLSTTANLSIKNQNVGGGGNDFALDDITFRPVCSLTDTIIVQIDSISVSASDDQTFCANAIDSITSIANYPNSSYSWNNNLISNTILPDTSGQYIVTATSPNQCSI